jgi:hypothetical protein
MPSSMLHLYTANRYNLQSSTLFYIGNIAPDCVYERTAKDRTHLRDRENRLNALHELAITLDMQNDFHVGVLLHLYTDYKWDTEITPEYICNYGGENWFLPYRNEITLSGSNLYHHTPWSAQIWNDMAEYSEKGYQSISDFPCEDIHAFILRNRTWHSENNLEASKAFTPELTKNFAMETANSFRVWVQKYL